MYKHQYIQHTQIYIDSGLFTDLSPISQVQQLVAYYHQLLPLGTEYKILHFLHNLIHQPNKKTLVQPKL